MWLLDANMDVHLIPLLAELGVPSESAIHRGWRDLVNGELVAAAVATGFDCLLTQDRRFVESASAALRANPMLAVVVVALPQRPWRQYLEEFRVAWETAPIRPIAGETLTWPAQ